MPKMTFMGAGSTVFAKSVLGDALLSPALRDAHIALYDIEAKRRKGKKGKIKKTNRYEKHTSAPDRFLVPPFSIG